MDTQEDNSIKVTAFLFLCDGVHKVVIDRGLSNNTTVKELKVKLCSLATDIGHEQVDPDKAKLIWDFSKLEDDNMTLGSLPSSPLPALRKMFLLPDIARARWKQQSEEETRWLDICTQVREEEEARQQEVKEGVMSSLSREKRPKINGQQLPYAQFGGLRFQGGCLDFGSHVPVTPKIETVPFSLSTVASVVLLVPNTRIYNTVLSSLPSPPNPMSKYLVILVSWDVLSYVFLRRLRRRYPQLPFVAVTDLDPHHLDLFTFLDTPPSSVTQCYGWHLGLDADDEETSFIREYEFAKIAWLGLRPSQLPELKRFDPSSLPAPAPAPARAPDFCKVIRMLEANPYLRSKKTWLKELRELEHYGKTVLLEASYDQFILKKLSEEDWK